MNAFKLPELPDCRLKCEKCGKPLLTVEKYRMQFGESESTFWLLGTRCTEGTHSLKPTDHSDEADAWRALGCQCVKTQ